MNLYKIGIVGTRGIPANYGGFETFAEKISERLASYPGYRVTVYCDRSDDQEASDKFGDVRLRYMSTTKGENPVGFYYQSIKLALKEMDILLVTGTGGSYFYFLNFFKKKVLITNTDGVESRRAKWSYLKRLYIKLSEYLSVHFSSHLIADSKGVTKYLLDTYRGLNPDLVSTIEYGAELILKADPDRLKSFGVSSNNYYLVVSRLEPENNVKMIVEGYLKSKSTLPLIVIGNLLDTDYCRDLTQIVDERVRFVGGVYDSETLSCLRYHSNAYLHGHSVGGTNPSLLEAMGSRNICICHDNIFNREVTDNTMLYFKDSNQVNQSLQILEGMDDEARLRMKEKAVGRIKDHYNWNRIADEYVNLFASLLKEKGKPVPVQD